MTAGFKSPVPRASFTTSPMNHAFASANDESQNRIGFVRADDRNHPDAMLKTW